LTRVTKLQRSELDSKRSQTRAPSSSVSIHWSPGIEAKPVARRDLEANLLNRKANTSKSDGLEAQASTEYVRSCNCGACSPRSVHSLSSQFYATQHQLVTRSHSTNLCNTTHCLAPIHSIGSVLCWYS